MLVIEIILGLQTLLMAYGVFTKKLQGPQGTVGPRGPQGIGGKDGVDLLPAKSQPQGTRMVKIILDGKVTSRVPLGSEEHLAALTSSELEVRNV